MKTKSSQNKATDKNKKTTNDTKNKKK